MIDAILPRSKFGSSGFTTPLLLLLRLFYQATSFDHAEVPPQRYSPRASIWKLYHKASTVLGPDQCTEAALCAGTDGMVDLVSKIPTIAWPSLVSFASGPISPTATVQSMTWVKSLSAPLSHEYLQFVIECSESRKRFRLIAERDTDGDWAYLIASSTANEKVTQLRPYGYQHDLPLPLLSVSWSHVPSLERPTIAQLSTVLAQVSQLCPEYNVMREHCWWYAELVFEQMYGSIPSGRASSVSRPNKPRQPRLKHWPSGPYRYSYVVLDNRWLKRSVLVDRARAFKEAMDEGGYLRW